MSPEHAKQLTNDHKRRAIPLRKHLFASFSFGVVLAVIAGFGLSVFIHADWFTHSGSDHGVPGTPTFVPWEGFSRGQFLGLFAFTVCAPLAATLLFNTLQVTVSISTSRQMWAKPFDALTFNSGPVVLAMCGGLILIAAGLTGGLWAWTILRCGAVFCVDTSVWSPPLSSKTPSQGNGWKAAVGCAALFSLCPLGVSVILSTIMNMRQSSRDAKMFDAVTSANVGTNDINGVDSNIEYGVVVNGLLDGNGNGAGASGGAGASAGAWETAPLVGFGVSRQYVPYKARLRDNMKSSLISISILLLIAFCTTVIPNSWQYFTPDQIAAFAQMQTSNNATECLMRPIYTCPEYNTSTFLTRNVRVSDFWYLKLFPGNVFFYGLLIGAVMIATLANNIEGIGNVLRQVRMIRTGYTRSTLCLFTSYGELWLSMGMLTTASLIGYYWLVDHNYNNYWPNDMKTVTSAEIIARGLGQLAVMMMGLLLIPVSRSSPLLQVFGVSWESSITYHRCLGILFLVFAAAHMIANYVWYSRTGAFPHDVLAIPMHPTHHYRDNFTIPLLTVILWVSFISIGVFAGFDYFRRACYELFYFAHHITYCLLIPAVLWHAAAGWELLLPGLVLWFGDRLLRAYRSAVCVHDLSLRPLSFASAGSITEMACRTNKQCYPGQYCFIRVAEFSIWQWHPFTVSSVTTSGRFTFHIKAVGDPNSFTHKLFDAALAQQQQCHTQPHAATEESIGIMGSKGMNMERLCLSIDGPYGSPIDYSRFQRIVLLAAGVGVTPCKCIFEALQLQYDADVDVGAGGVHLLWSAKHESVFEIMQHSLASVPSFSSTGDSRHSDSPFTASLFVTDKDDDTNTSNSPYPTRRPQDRAVGNLSSLVLHRRLDIKRTLPQRFPETGASTMLFACGPQAFVMDAKCVACHQQWTFKSEEFTL